MGELDTFEVFILNPYSEAAFGSTLRGQIVIDCPDDMDVSEISVYCHGLCRLGIFDYRMAAMSMVPRYLSKTLMHTVHICFPPEQPQASQLEGDDSSISSTDKDNATLAKGTHVFDFNFDIPDHCPASFEGEYGYIRYFIRAHVQYLQSAEYNVRDFKVVPVLDLNCLPDVEVAVEKEMTEEVFSLFKSIGFHRAKMFLHKAGYVPGDTLHVGLDIHNDTDKVVTRALLRLKMVTTYLLPFQSRQVETVLGYSKLSPIDAGYTFHGCDRNLRIPDRAPIISAYPYRHVNIQYFIELFIKPSILSLDGLKMSVRIEVGTVPIATERIMASLHLREPPPRYEDLLPSYENAINHLAHKSMESYECPHHSSERCSGTFDSLHDLPPQDESTARGDEIREEVARTIE